MRGCRPVGFWLWVVLQRVVLQNTLENRMMLQKARELSGAIRLMSYIPGLDPTTRPQSRTEPWLSELTPKERKQTKFHSGLCCLLRRRHQRSPTELLFTLSDSSLLERDKPQGEWSAGNSTHLEGSQAGKKHTACKRKPRVPAPRARI